MFKKFLNDKKGAAMVEYGLVVAGVALIGAGAASLLGHKTNDLYAAMAVVLPGAHADDNGAVLSGKLIETKSAEDGPISIDDDAIENGNASERLSTNLGATKISDLIVEPTLPSGGSGGGGT